MSSYISANEVKKHNHRKSVWMVIRGEVYDVTSFLNEHPGGEDPLLDAAGLDATIAFESVGHSADAKIMMAKYRIGTLTPGEGCTVSPVRSHYKPPASPRIERRIHTIVVPRERRGGVCRPVPPPPRSSGSKWKWALLALGVAIVAGIAYKKYASG